jgi:hypothetical protein
MDFGDRWIRAGLGGRSQSRIQVAFERTPALLPAGTREEWQQHEARSEPDGQPDDLRRGYSWQSW